jgi:hypothetical protein
VRRSLVVAVLFAASSAVAQEIGSEIPVSPPPGSQGQGGSPAYMPGPPPDLSAKPFSFGLRASMGGSGLISQPSTSGSPGAVVPTLGIKLLVANALAINIDAGLAIGILAFSGGLNLGFTIGGGVEIRFRTEKDALRPFLAFQGQFSKGFSGFYGDLAIGASAGGGAEYFFHKQFSMSVRGMIGFLIDLNAASVVLATFTPGVLATVYF